MESHRTSESRLRHLWQSVAAALPTAAVLIALGAVAVWGHSTGWKAPRFGQLRGVSSSAGEDWCTSHNVPDSKCIACHPELAGESAADWCKEHGVPESKCTTCHPEILTAGVAGDWCKEHGLPESGCTLCHPEIARRSPPLPDEQQVTVTPSSAPASAPAAMLRDPRTCQTHASKVQFASADSLRKAGIRLARSSLRAMVESVAVYGEIDYDRTRYVKIASRVPGAVASVERELGTLVRVGDLMALVDSPEIGRAKAEYLQGVAGAEASAAVARRMQTSSAAGFRTDAERLEADALARAAEIRLFNARQALVNLGLTPIEGRMSEEAIVTLGIPDAILKRLPAGSVSANLVPVLAPLDGTVVSRSATRGQVVVAGELLFELADTTRMWITMDVPQVEARRIALGTPVTFHPDGARDEAVAGSVNWISTSVDEVARTVKVRADVRNPDGALRANTFGRAYVVMRTAPEAVVIPSEAVQWEGCCYVVFVRLADEIFQTRKVRIGAKDGVYTEVIAGLLADEAVVTTGSHVLKSEVLKSRLGAGCTDH